MRNNEGDRVVRGSVERESETDFAVEEHARVASSSREDIVEVAGGDSQVGGLADGESAVCGCDVRFDVEHTREVVFSSDDDKEWACAAQEPEVVERESRVDLVAVHARAGACSSEDSIRVGKGVDS